MVNYHDGTKWKITLNKSKHGVSPTQIRKLSPPRLPCGRLTCSPGSFITKKRGRCQLLGFSEGIRPNDQQTDNVSSAHPACVRFQTEASALSRALQFAPRTAPADVRLDGCSPVCGKPKPVATARNQVFPLNPWFSRENHGVVRALSRVNHGLITGCRTPKSLPRHLYSWLRFSPFRDYYSSLMPIVAFLTHQAVQFSTR